MQRGTTVIRDWAILWIGAPLILGGLYLASLESATPLSVGPVTAQRPNGEQRLAKEEALSETNAQQEPAAAKPSAPAEGPQPGETAKTVTTLSQEPVQPAAAEQHNHAEKLAETAAPSAAPHPPVTGDAAKGEQVFRKCRACHSLETGKNTVGPSLAGVFGRKAGALPN